MSVILIIVYNQQQQVSGHLVLTHTLDTMSTSLQVPVAVYGGPPPPPPPATRPSIINHNNNGGGGGSHNYRMISKRNMINDDGLVPGSAAPGTGEGNGNSAPVGFFLKGGAVNGAPPTYQVKALGASKNMIFEKLN